MRICLGGVDECLVTLWQVCGIVVEWLIEVELRDGIDWKNVRSLARC